MEKTVALPLPTNSTRVGPYIIAENGGVRIKYDFERNDGTLEWSEIAFEEVLAYRFHQSICYQMDTNIVINKFNELIELNTSSWLRDVLCKWDAAVGWQEYQINKGGKLRFKHYIVEFDDVGVCEIICSSYRIGNSD